MQKLILLAAAALVAAAPALALAPAHGRDPATDAPRANWPRLSGDARMVAAGGHVLRWTEVGHDTRRIEATDAHGPRARGPVHPVTGEVLRDGEHE